RILIVGAGAVGGYFGGRLAQAGRDVTFLVRPSRAKQLSQDGLRIISPHGDAVLSPTLISADKIDAPYDIIFLSVKAYALEAALQGAGFDARLSPEIMQAMWEKWVQLASLGAITCLMRGTIGEIVAAPGGADLSIDALNESVAVATACGQKPSEKVLSRHAAAMTAPGSSLTSSMYRDLRKGAPVEADHILGDFIERGSARGVATPLLKAAFVNLRIYQNRLP